MPVANAMTTDRPPNTEMRVRAKGDSFCSSVFVFVVGLLVVTVCVVSKTVPTVETWFVDIVGGKAGVAVVIILNIGFSVKETLAAVIVF